MKVKKLSMTNQVMVAMVFGIGAGLLFKDRIIQIQIIGDIFLRLIQMTVIILVMGQIIEAVGGLNTTAIGRVGVKTIAIFTFSSLLASFYGIIIALLFKLGQGLSIQTSEVKEAVTEAESFTSFGDLILDFFPTNIMNSLSEGSIVQIVIFAIIFGVDLSQAIQENSNHQLIDLIVQFNGVILKVVNMVMNLALLGIFSIIAVQIGELGIQVILPLTKYLLVYAFGTFTFLFLWLVVASVYSRCHMIKLVQKLMKVSMMTLATTSSVVTFPTALKTTEVLGVSSRIAKFIIPLGTSINRNGAAMFMAITVVAIGQMYQLAYSQQEYFFIAILVTLISLAGAGIPGAGEVSLAIVVPQMNLPVESIALFVGVEWFTGMLRTILNVDADILTALVIAKSEKELDREIFNQTLESQR